MSENLEKNSQKRIVSDLKFPLPDTRSSFETQLDIIKAYVVTSNIGKEPVGYKELESSVKIEPTTVSGCNKFFQHLGIIEMSEKTGKYLPTALSIELYNGLKWKNAELTKSVIRKIVDKSWFWNTTRQFLEVNESANRSELVQKLGITCSADPQKHTRALDKLIEYLKYGDLIREVDGVISLNSSLTADSPDVQHTNDVVQPLKINEDVITSGRDLTPIVDNIDITLGIMIDASMSEEQIRKTVRVIIDEIKSIREKHGVD